METTDKTGLILTGGGARAAYQIGVLDALASILREAGWAPERNPFNVICGTSAGAINATALACQIDHFGRSVRSLREVWSNFTVDQVYRADSLGVIRSGARWLSLFSFGWLLRKWHANPPQSLLDNTPLVTLLHRLLDLPRLDSILSSGLLDALAVTASSYTGGQHVTFYQSANEFASWQRIQRTALRGQIGVEHLLASSAIPFIFPAVPIFYEGHCEYFGDGSMRQTAPLSPAIHLGANRILVVGAGRMGEEAPPPKEVIARYPTLAQVAGHALSSIFLDGLAVDIERIRRVNQTLSFLTPEQRSRMALKPIETLVIAPSQRIDDIACRHVHSLPRPIRAMLGGIGATEARGGVLASYLLFEKGFTSELIELGRKDTFERRAAVLLFFEPKPDLPVDS
ncbi:MAG: Patatin [Herbaspirillum sp.]|nr:Patatin [Herbaspirillum sp.]